MTTTYRYYLVIPSAAGIDVGAGLIRKSKGFLGSERTEWAVMSEALEREAYRTALAWAQAQSGMSAPSLLRGLIQDRLIPCPPRLAAQVQRWKNG